MTDFVTSWDGAPLTHYEQLCLRTFLARGHRVELASYGNPVNVPDGVTVIDARDFLPLDRTMETLLAAKAYAKVADLLRYRLLADGTRTWVDVDVMLIADDVPTSPTLLGFEDDKYVNNAILRLEPGSELLAALLEATADPDPEQLLAAKWGAIGPLLLTRLSAELGLRDIVQPVAVLYPVASRDLWRLFDPREISWCEEVLEGAATLHLWNEFLRRAKLKTRSPARGSWLEQQMSGHGIDARGRRIDPRWVRGPWRQQLPDPPPVVARRGPHLTARRLLGAAKRRLLR